MSLEADVFGICHIRQPSAALSCESMMCVAQIGPGTGNNGPGREATTEFTRLAVWPDGATSLVECRQVCGNARVMEIHPHVHLELR